MPARVRKSIEDHRSAVVPEAWGSSDAVLNRRTAIGRLILRLVPQLGNVAPIVAGYYATMQNKLKHLELIQGVINRLSTNSFLLKGWSVVLVSALFALSASDRNPAFVFLAYFPAFVFWGLDGFFLWQEQLYRALYNHVRLLKDEEVDFSMDTTRFRTGTGPSWPAATLSKTLIAFHGILIVAIVIVTILGSNVRR